MNLSDNNKNSCYDNVDQYTSSIVTTTTTTTMSTANIQNFFKQRHQANARERYRTRSVNSAFTTLRQLIPTQPQNRKLSKIETLRLAKSYIEHLGATLTTGTSIQPCSYVKTVQKELLLNDNYLRNGSNICTFCLTTKSN